MTEEQNGNRQSPVANPQKKKASWARTIVWIISMMLLVNIVMGVIFYIVLK